MAAPAAWRLLPAVPKMWFLRPKCRVRLIYHASSGPKCRLIVRAATGAARPPRETRHFVIDRPTNRGVAGTPISDHSGTPYASTFGVVRRKSVGAEFLILHRVHAAAHNVRYSPTKSENMLLPSRLQPGRRILGTVLRRSLGGPTRLTHAIQGDSGIEQVAIQSPPNSVLAIYMETNRCISVL